MCLDNTQVGSLDNTQDLRGLFRTIPMFAPIVWLWRFREQIGQAPAQALHGGVFERRHVYPEI